MPYPLPTAGADAIRRQYELERSLARQIREASWAQRPGLYRDLYAELYRDVPELAHKDPERRRRSIRSQIAFLAPLVRGRRGFLDIGCGDGALAVAVARLIPEVYALDVVPPVSEAAEYRFLPFDGRVIPLPDAAVDVAHSSQVLEHVHPDDALPQLREIHRVLRPGGIHLCTTPNRLSGPHDVSRFFDDEAAGLHLREYTVGEAVSLFREAGFRCRALFPLRGYRRLPVPVFRTVEGMMARLPRPLRNRLARGMLRRFVHMIRLVAVKV
jgi:SAM-dependent methyltransferase